MTCWNFHEVAIKQAAMVSAVERHLVVDASKLGKVKAVRFSQLSEFDSLITEKGLSVKETEGTLVFDVAPDASKIEVKQAVEALFKVKVAAVRTANVLGKERRRGKFSGFRPDWKKAYVRLKAGEKMPDYVNAM